MRRRRDSRRRLLFHPLPTAVELGVVIGNGVADWLDVREYRDRRKFFANVRLDLLQELMPSLDAPIARDEDMHGNKAARARLPRAQRVELHALLFVIVQD